MKILIPTDQEVAEITLGKARLTEYGDWYFNQRVPIAGGASWSDYAENKMLDHFLGKSSTTMPATVAIALCTVVPTDASTGASITEAGYTGYARIVLAAANLSAAASGESHNTAQLTGGACTASSSTVIGFAVCDASGTGAGNALCWGTTTSTVISTTQTPPTIAASGLSVTQD